MYKKCAQLVETWGQNLVEAFTQYPQKPKTSSKNPQPSQHLHSFTRQYTHRQSHVLHKQFLQNIPVKNRFYTLYTQPTTTTTTYINNKRTTKEVL